MLQKKNFGRSFVEGGHKESSNIIRKNAHRSQRMKVRVLCRQFGDTEQCDEIHPVEMLKKAWCGSDIHGHYGRNLLERFFASRMGMHIDIATGVLFRRHDSDSFRDRLVREVIQDLLKSVIDFPYLRPFTINEFGIVVEPALAPWMR